MIFFIVFDWHILSKKSYVNKERKLAKYVQYISAHLKAGMLNTRYCISHMTPIFWAIEVKELPCFYKIIMQTVKITFNFLYWYDIHDRLFIIRNTTSMFKLDYLLMIPYNFLIFIVNRGIWKRAKTCNKYMVHSFISNRKSIMCMRLWS